jgi:hypothetical protein
VGAKVDMTPYRWQTYNPDGSKRSNGNSEYARLREAERMVYKVINDLLKGWKCGRLFLRQ